MAKRFNRPDAAGVLHYVTLNVREKRRPFAKEAYARIALDELRKSCDLHPAHLLAYVVMPDHLHFITEVSEGDLTVFLSSFKSAVTRNSRRRVVESGNDRLIRWLSQGGGSGLWQEGKHSLHLWSGYMIRMKINYIHHNPVAAGLVERQVDYPWSSVGSYFPEWGVTPPTHVDTVWK